MKRLNIILSCGLLALAGSAVAAGDKDATAHRHKARAASHSGKGAVAPHAPVRLSAEEIVHRNVKARGGEGAWQKVETLTLSGKLEAGGKQNTELPYVMKMKRPEKSRLELVFQNQTAVQTWDGEKGWKTRPFLGRSDAEPFTPAEARAASDWQPLDGPLIDHERKGIHVSLVGTDTVEGHPAYELSLTMKDGTERKLWIDARTFLEAKVEGEPRKLDGRVREVSIFYRDFKTEHGLTTPRLYETVVQGVKDTHKMQVEKLVVNEAMDDKLFAQPNLSLARAGK